MPQPSRTHRPDVPDAGRNMTKLLEAIVFDLHVAGITTSEPIAFEVVITEIQILIDDIGERV
jgi:hypothetical protein